MSRGEEKYHRGAKLFLLSGNIWRPDLRPDCFVWLHFPRTGGVWGGGHVSCVFLWPRLGASGVQDHRVHWWSVRCPALGSWEPAPNPLCRCTDERFSPKIVFYAFHLDADGSRSRFKRPSCVVLGQIPDVEWKCWGECILRKNCFVGNGGSVHPSSAAQSRRAWSVAWMAAWSEVFGCFFFFLMLRLLFLLLTPDTLWQRGCEEQPGLAASLPRIYIPGL